MICFKCDSGQDAGFFKETFPCAHCEEDNLIEFNLCPDCGWMWRSVNGIPTDDSMVHADEFGEFANLLMGGLPPEMTDDDAAMIDNINEHMIRIDKIDNGEASMADYMHKCIQCESTAVDVNNGQYKCIDCGFEWEIVKFE